MDTFIDDLNVHQQQDVDDSPEETTTLRELFHDIHDRLDGIRQIISALDDPVAMEILEELDYEALRHVLKLRNHLNVPY